MPAIAPDVFVIKPFLENETPTGIFSESDVRWLFDKSKKRSFSAYWRDVSGGIFDINATVHPILNVQVSQASLTLLTMPGGRLPAVNEAMRLLKDAGRQFGPDRKAVIFIGGFVVDAGAAPAVLNNQIWSTAYLD